MKKRPSPFCLLAFALPALGAIAGCSGKASSGNSAGTGGVTAQETGGSAGPGIGGSTAAGGAAGFPTTNASGGATGSGGAAAMGGVGAGGASGTGGMTGAAGDGSGGSLATGGATGAGGAAGAGGTLAAGGTTGAGGSTDSCKDPAVMALFPACAATKDEASCTEQGGSWRLLASSLGGTCVCPTGDGGCPCSSSSDCLGYCISTRLPLVGAGADYCASFTKFTCSSTYAAPGPDCWCRPESPYAVCYP